MTYCTNPSPSSNHSFASESDFESILTGSPAALKKRYPVMTQEEFQKNWADYRAGSEKARDRILMANQGLVHRCIKSIAAFHASDRDDYFQQAQMGLYHALQKCDPTLGAFSTYATRWIQSYVQELRLNLSSDVYVPQTTRKFRSKVTLLLKKLDGDGVKDPVSEAARQLGVPVSAIQAMQALRRQSLEEPVNQQAGSDKPVTILDTVAEQGEDNTESEAHKDSLARVIGDLLLTLDEREAEAVRLYFGLSGIDCEERYAEVGRQLGISREHARNVYKKSVEKLRLMKEDVRVKDALAGIG